MKKHIMVIDDDKDELTLFLDALKDQRNEEEFKCTYAASTTQALNMLKYLVPDYIFVDFNMPIMNGLDFLEAIKKQAELNKTRVFLYSTHIDEETQKKAMSLGASGCIKKANSIRSLSKKLSLAFTPSQLPAYIFSGGNNQ